MEPDKQMLVCSTDTGVIYSIKNSFAGTCWTGNRGTETLSGIKKERKPGKPRLISKQVGISTINNNYSAKPFKNSGNYFTCKQTCFASHETSIKVESL